MPGPSAPTAGVPRRAHDGVLLLDKPLGISSSQALQRVRRLLNGVKGGHTGALDPLATGMLPLCFGEATKIAGILLSSRKSYRAELRLGQTTSTDDAEGELLQERPVPALQAAELDAALAHFTGRFAQRAPVYSALKQGGQPLYRRVRRGEAVEAPVREVEVFALRRLAQGADQLSLEIVCGSGFYVRSLARDLGERLGCGAHLCALRRQWVEPFQDLPMLGLDALVAMAPSAIEATLRERLIPIERALAHWPQWPLDEAESRAIVQGRSVSAPPAAGGTAPSLLRDPEGRPLALAIVEAGRWRILRGFRIDALEGAC